MNRQPSPRPNAALENITFKPASVRRLPSRVTARPDTATLAVLDRIHGEFAEMPGLSLTTAQASRLMGVQEETCARLLRHLVDAGVLRERGDGRYVLRTDAA